MRGSRRNAARAHGEPTTLRAGQQLTCPLFPGITADVGRLFAAP